MGRVDVVLEKLLSLPDTSIQKLDEVHTDVDVEKLPRLEKRLGLPDTSLQIRDDDPLRLWLRMEENAEKLVGLAREFVDALDEEGGSGTLRQRALRFISLTETNPSVNIPRERAYQRIMEAFRQASPDVEVKRPKVSQLNMGTGSGSCSDKYIDRSDVERYLAGAGSLVWEPHRCYNYYRHLADITGDVEFASLAGETENCLRIIDAFHLWGCFLLLASHDEFLPAAYRNVCHVLKHWREPASALKEAAKNVAAAWRTEQEQRDSQAEASGAGTGKKSVDSEVLEAGDTVSRCSSKSKQPVVEKITVKKGHDSFQLVAEGRPAVSIDTKPFYPLFMSFTLRLAKDAPGEIVPWQELNAIVGANDETRASDLLRGYIDDLRKKLAGLGISPDGDDFILTVRGKGCRLNTSCKWEPDKKVQKEYGRVSQSVDGRWTDPQTMAKNKVDKDHKLSAQPNHPSQRREDDDEE